MKRFLLLILICTCATLVAQVPAFPGAEGGGKYTIGGRGGKVLVVTSLADDGSEGTLRWAIDRDYPRIIVFAVSGWIDLNEQLLIDHGNVTIAGQTAPGGGIGVRYFPLKIKADNVIVRYMRFRLGDVKFQNDDAFSANKCKNLMIDHCSMSWSVDECASVYGNTDATMQWCIISESLGNSEHKKGAHGYGGIWGGTNASFHHNLMAHHTSRNPRLCGSRYTGQPALESADLRNNVFYNWGPINSGYAGEGGSYNFVNNYYKPGPSTATKKDIVNRIFQPNYDDGKLKNKKGTWGQFYVAGNYFDGSSTAIPEEYQKLIKSVNEDNWVGINPRDTTRYWNGWKTIRSDKEFSLIVSTTQTPQQAYEEVLEHAGASFVRDATDKRIIENVRKGNFSYKGSRGSNNGIIDSQNDVGGWSEIEKGVAPKDSDKDGMPDEWEKMNDLNPDKYNANNFTLNDDYTDLEMYFEWILKNK